MFNVLPLVGAEFVLLIPRQSDSCQFQDVWCCISGDNICEILLNVYHVLSGELVALTDFTFKYLRQPQGSTCVYEGGADVVFGVLGHNAVVGCHVIALGRVHGERQSINIDNAFPIMCRH